MKSRLIGQCIYCRTTEPPLSNEHTVPLGFNGDCVLLKASCKACAAITSNFEKIVLRDTLFAARAAVGARTRRPKDRDQTRTMHVIKDGKEQAIEAHWKEHWKVIPLPVFEPPAFLDRRNYKGGVEANRMDFGWIGEGPQEIAKLHNADDVLFKMSKPINVAYAFAKLLAKIAYGNVVLNFGLSGIKEAFVVPAILGESDDIGRWVGCDGKRIMPSDRYNLWHTIIEVVEGLYLARIKLFTKANGTDTWLL
jgi:hypothetical protein